MSTAPTFNKFKSTTIYGNFNNVDFTDSAGGVITPATAYFQRDVTSSGIIYGKKLFYDNVDISSTFVSNLTLSSTLSNYALSSALSNYALSSTLSNYALSSALTPYALSSSLNNYALLTGAAFTGNVTGVTAQPSDSSQKFATTSFVKGQNYATNAQLNTVILTTPSIFNPTFQNTMTINYIDPNGFTSYYPLTIANTSGTLSLNTSTGSYPITLNASNLQLSKDNGTNYYDVLTTNTGVQLTGATFTGNVSGLTTTTSDNTTKFATTAFVKAQNYITSSALSPYALSSALSNYALSSSLSNYALSSSLSNYALLSGATFSGNVSGLTAASTDNSTKFATTAFVKAQNYLTTASLSYSTITVPTTNTLDNFQGNYWTQYSVRPTNSVTTLNGVTTVNIGLPLSNPPSTTQILISNTFYALGTVANPDTSQSTQYCVISSSYGATPTNTTNFFNINMYNANNGTLIRGYGTLLKSFSTNSYSIIFVATGGVVFTVNTPYTFDPFQFTYI